MVIQKMMIQKVIVMRAVTLVKTKLITKIIDKQ